MLQAKHVEKKFGPFFKYYKFMAPINIVLNIYFHFAIEPKWRLHFPFTFLSLPFLNVFELSYYLHSAPKLKMTKFKDQFDVLVLY